MCLEPTTLAALTLAAQSGSAVMQHQAQSAQADYTDKSNNIARMQFALEEDLQRMDAERLRLQQHQQDTSEVDSMYQSAMRDRAALEVLVGEYGAGTTGERRLSALGIREGQDLATMAGNASKRQSELGFAGAAAIGGTRAKLASLRPSERPSMLGLGLQIGGAGLQYGSRMHDIKNPRPGAGTGPGSTSLERWMRTGSGGD